MESEGDEEQTTTVQDNNSLLETISPIVMVKQEPADDMKDYAETTMNELLGLYGYEKVSSIDTENLKLDSYTSEQESSPVPRTGHRKIKVKSERTSPSSSDLESSSLKVSSSASSLLDAPSSLAAQHKNLVSALSRQSGSPLPSCHTSLVDSSESGTIYIECAWCQNTGLKLFTLKSSSGTKAFCSEICFTQCRRASFKKNKVCDWCKHIRYTVDFLDFQDGDLQLQFCSEKCLSQYKMDIFCRETTENLKQIQESPEACPDVKQVINVDDKDKKQILITPDLWLKSKKKKSDKQRRREKRERRRELAGGVVDKIKKERIESPIITDMERAQLTIPDTSARQVKDTDILSKSYVHTKQLSSILSSAPSHPSQLPSHSTDADSNPVSNLPPPWVLHPHLYAGPPVASFAPTYPASTQAHSTFSHKSHGEATVREVRERYSCTVPRRQPPPDRSQKGEGGDGSQEAHSTDHTNPNTPLMLNLPGTMPFFLPPGASMPPLAPPPVSQFPRLLAPPGPFPFPSALNTTAMGGPPVTVMIPFPVPLPIPIPIPIPIPMPREAYNRLIQNSKQSPSSSSSRPSSSSESTHKGERGAPSRLFTNGVTSSPVNLSPRSMEAEQISPYVSGTTRLCRSAEPLQLPNTFPYSPPTDRFSTPASVEMDYFPGDSVSREAESIQQRYQGPQHGDTSKWLAEQEMVHEAIDLTKYKLKREALSATPDTAKEFGRPRTCSPDTKQVTKSCSSRTSSPFLDSQAGTVECDSSCDDVPKIHIVSSDEPLLSHSELLPAAESAYSKRRGLILDAPCVPKRPRSPTPERRVFVRTAKGYLFEARRRCARARIKTK